MHSTAFHPARSLHPVHKRFSPSRLALALSAGALLSLAMLPAQSQVLPTGLQVVAGQAQVSTAGNRMTVVNSPQSILNWNSFSIGSGQSVYFQQANAASQVLNRVVGNDPSQILGSLGSNGRVWLLNPNGVLFGQGARVDVAGLVTSTLRLNDSDWLAGQYRFNGDGNASASVVNQGKLRSSFGGSVALIAADVRNEGLVQAPGGQIILAAGHSVELVDTGAPNLGVRVTAPAGAARNLGELQAAGGRIDIHAAAVNQQGIVSADALSTGAGGEVWIKASLSADLGPASRTSANGAGGDAGNGGSVHVESTGGRTTVQGSVSAQAGQGVGGRVALLGREVGLVDGSTVNASGAMGGGEVLVGGGVQGKDTRVANARAVYFGPQASIAADALERGDGGNIVLWSDTATRAFGTLSARGGRLSGNGGQIETSGGWLDARPARVDTLAPRGKAGNWLLDPSDIDIGDSVSDSGFDANFSVTGASASISSSAINSALANGNVTITTSGGTGGLGDIMVSSATLANAFSSIGTLTLNADRNITFSNSEFGAGSSGSSGLTLRAGLGGSGSITVSNSSVDTAGRVVMAADSVSLTGFTSVVSWGGGDAIVLSGRNNGPMTQFTNSSSAASGTLAAPAGRWIVYFDDFTSPAFNDGGLSYDFKRHGAAFGAWSGDSGNGFVFRAPQTAVATGTVLPRAYDGTTNAPVLSDAEAVGLSGDFGTVSEGVVAHYANKNVGVGKAVTIDPLSFDFVDGNDKPVYGYRVVTSITGTVTPVALSGTPIASNKVYDGSAATYVVVPTVLGVVGGDSVSVIGDATFDNKNVGQNKPVSIVGSYQVIDGSTGTSTGNYTFSPLGTKGLSASITPRPLNVFGLAVSDKVYDATTAATLAGQPTFDAVAGDQVSLGILFAANFLDKNVGKAKPVVVTGLSLSGADASNYQLQPVPNLSASITPRPVDLSGLSVASKVYDATTAASLSGSASLTPLPGDQVTLGGSLVANFADKNVGVGKSVLLSGLSLSGADAGNYSAASSANLKADITPRPVTVQGLVASNKVYDGTVVATLAPGASVNVLPGDDAVLGTTLQASFADKNVGTGKSVSLTGAALSGADAGNYSLAAPAGLKADITPRAVTVGGLAVVDKVYDATTAATLSGTAAFDSVPGDVLNLTGTPSASFADKNVGQAKPVALTGLAMGGADAGNYTLQPLQLTGNITPRTLALGGLTAADKVYDATTAATLSGTASISGLSGDVVTLGGTPSASFADKRVGQAKPVTVTGLQLGGADAGNYSLASAGLSAAITPRPVTVTGLSAADKVYDATTLATLSGAGSVAALPGDAVALSGTPSGRFADKNVGVNKAVSISGFTLGGADGGNYSLQAPDSLRASITPLAVAVSGLSANDKVYDGGTTATLSGNARVAALAGDTVSVSGAAAASFADRNVGAGKPVSVSGFSLAGADAGNYRLSLPLSLSASITPASLLYVAAPEVRSTGQGLDGLQGSVSGLVGGDTLANATQGTLLFTAQATPSSPPGNYAVIGSGLQARNYVLSQAPGNASALTIVVDLSPVVAAIVGTDAVTGPSVTAPVIPPAVRVDRPLPEAGMLDLSGGSGGLGGGTVVTGFGGSGTSSGGASSGGSSGGSAGAAGGAGGSGSFTLADAAASSNFGPVKLASLSSSQLQSLLAGRNLYMQNLLADSVARLERNPALADLRECQTLQQAEQGECLITARLKERIGTAGVPAAPAATPAPSTAAAAPTPAPAPAPPASGGLAPPAAPAAAPTPAPAPTAPSAAAAVAAQFDQLLASPNVRSASLPQINRKIALVVGVDRYADPSIPTLGNAVRDAQAVAKVFETRLGYQAVVLENATRASLVSALNRLALSVGPRDSVVVYYAGHGELVEATKLGYWLLSDSVAKQPETWLSNTDINRLVAQIGASQVALVSDSCYSGSLVSEERIRPVATPPNPSLILDRKSVVVMSSGGNEPVFDDGKDGHSPFAYNLMNTLGQLSNWQPGGNVFERVRFAVARTLPQRPQYSASRAAGHQAGGDYLFEQRQIDVGK